jgi:hypothetical protein
MKTKFKYDYNWKMFIVCLSYSLLFLSIFIWSINKNIVGCIVVGGCTIALLFTTCIFILNQGITVGKKNILIIDYFWFTKINLSNLKRVELKEIKKDKKSNWYGLLNEFYHPSTYMYNSDYVYNNGRVFKIIFYLEDNSTRESYFGWMYKERSITKVNKVVNKLESFIRKINLSIQENKK